MKISRILDSSPNWEDPDPEVRLNALKDRRPPDELLARLAKADKDARVRSAAIEHVNDPALLRTLFDDPDPAIARVAADQWVNWLNTRDEAEAHDHIKAVDHHQALVSIATLAASNDLRIAGVNRIDDPNRLLQVMAADNHASVYHACANRIEDEATLEAVLKRFLNKDKNVVHIARQKLADIKHAREQHDALIKQCAAIRESFEHLKTSDYNDLFERRFAVLDQDWRSVMELANDETRSEIREYQEAIEAARAACQKVIAEIPEQRRQHEADAQAVINELVQLREQLTQGAAGLAVLGTRLAQLRSHWPIGLGDEHGLARQYYQAITELENLAGQFRLVCALPPASEAARLKSALARINWPEDFKRPALLDTSIAKVASLQEEAARQTAERERELDVIGQQMDRLEQAIGEGKLKPANKAHSTLRKHLDKLEFELPREQSERFTRLAQQLRELKDWQGFVTNPKREALCEQMEALGTNAEMPPPEKAKAIKALQEEWKGLGPSDSRQSQQLWSRFKKAADVAFKPCAEFFAEQRQVREQHLAERNRICEMLETFFKEHDWDNPDWKAAHDLVRNAHRAWREHNDIPHARRKKVQQRFNRALKPMEARLAEEQNRNHAAKQALIDKVAALVADESLDMQARIQGAKQAQSDWKQVGITDRRTDQKLWKSFRSQCDLVFQQRDEASKQARAEEGKARDAAEQLTRKLKKLTDDQEIDKSQIRKIESELSNIDLGKQTSQVKKEFKRHVRRAEKVIEAQAQASKYQALMEARRKAELCIRLEQGELTDADVEQQWEGEIEIPPAIQSRLDGRRAAAGSSDAATRDANLETAQLLCIRLEILAELPSPPEAQQQRMAYQVERLNRELSQGLKETRTPQEQAQDIMLDWYCLGPLPEGSKDLYRRFDAAEAKLGPGNK